MTRKTRQRGAIVGSMFGLLALHLGVISAQDAGKSPPTPKKASASVVAQDDFQAVMTRMQAAKAAIQLRQNACSRNVTIWAIIRSTV